jgi:hypothetical protein
MLGSGGGGSGSAGIFGTSTYSYQSGKGAQGGSFSGGAGGGSASFSNGNWFDGENAEPWGIYGNYGGNKNGSGNPNGFGGNTTENGVGGTLIVMANGTISGGGSIVANGGSVSYTVNYVEWVSGNPGGASGGGVIALFSKGHATISSTANGGTSTGATSGGNGGNGVVYRFNWE